MRKNIWKHILKGIKSKRNLTARAEKRNARVIVPFSKADIIKRDGSFCYICGKILSFKKATIDHVKPISKGGHHSPHNAKIACMPCNSEKGDDCRGRN